MSFCKNCNTDVTLSPTAANKCPSCGCDLFAVEGKSPGDTSREEDIVGEMTVAFTPGGTIPAGQIEPDSEEEHVELDFTQVFGGKFAEEAEDDLGEDSGLEAIALDEASGPEVTQALGSSPSSSSGSDSRAEETVRRPSSSTAPDATHVAGVEPSDSGQSDWPSGVTMPVGLSGSDRAASGSPDTHRENETILHDSGTLAMGSGRRSSEIQTPISRDLTGLSSGRTIPRGPLGEGGASRSLKAGDVQFVGPEQIRLRAFGLSEGMENEQDVDFLLRASAGKGGMGIVYRSLQRSLDRDVAVKQMKPDLADSESDRNKFLTEAVITGQLEHPNIIPVHELGLAADGLPFYAMKYVIGDDWEDRLKKLSEQENLNILIQVSNAIAFAHSRNVIHRDLKPGNVRLGNFGEVLVMDWGLAARLDREGDIPPAGTPLYMAPETALEYLDHVSQQSTAEKAKTHRRIKAGTYSDVYLLGALLFKIVTGKAPHSGKTPFECLRNAAKNRIVKVERTSELLDIAYKAMATNPADRYRSVPEFVDALKSYQAHAQSILIARRAAEDLADAEEQRSAPGVNSTATYAIFSSAQHGFQNALDLWSENRKAKEQLRKCRQSFADTAYSNGDYDLALSLLEEEEDADSETVANIRRSQRLRQARLRWFRTLKYATAASLMLALAFIAYSVYARLDAIHQTQLAQEQQQKADEATRLADEKSKEAATQTKLAAAATQQAADATQQANEAARQASEAKLLAEKNQAAAENAKQVADAAKQQAAEAQVIADKAKEEARREKFIAMAGLVNSTLLERGPYAAWSEINKLQERDPEVIANATDEEKDNVEWKRLVRDTDWQREASEVKSIQLARPLLAVTADGKWLASAGNNGQDSEILLFDASDLTNPTHSAKLDRPVEQLAISSNGRFVATVSDASKLSLTDLHASRDLQFSEDSLANDVSVTAVAFDPSHNRLLTGGNDRAKSAKGQRGVLAEWLIDEAAGTVSRKPVDEGENHSQQVAAAGYSPDAKYAFTADGGGTIRLWERNNDQQLERFRTYDHSAVASGSPEITSAVMGTPIADNLPLAYGCADGNVYLLQIPLSPAISDTEDTPIAAGEKLSDDPQFVFVHSEKTTWAPDPRLRPDKLSQKHNKSVSDLAFAKEGTVLLSSGGDTIFVHDIGTSNDASMERKEMRRYHDTTVLSCAAGGNDTAYSTDEKGRVLEWKIDVPPDSRELNPGATTGKVTSIEVSSDSQPRLAVSDSGGFTRVWASERDPKLLEELVIGHERDRRLVAWHLPGPQPMIVTVAEDRRACLWDAKSGELLRTLDLGLRSVVAMSAQGDALLAATDVKPDPNKPKFTPQRIEATSFSLATPARKTLWEDYPRISAMLSFMSDSNTSATIAVGLRDGQVHLWHPDRGRILLAEPTSRPHWKPINSFAYDPQKQVLYSADSDGVISRWTIGGELPVSHEVARINKAQPEAVSRLELSADGSQLLAVVKANAINSRNLRVLDTSSLILAKRQPELLDGLVDAAYAPDGVTILAISAGSTIQECNPKTQEWTTPSWSSKVAKSLGRGESLSGIRVDTENHILLFGPGFAQLWEVSPNDVKQASQVRSRPPTQLVEFLSGDSDTVRSLSADGRLDLLSRSDSDTFVRKETMLEQLRGISHACSGPQEGEAYVAIRDAISNSTRFELWNLDRAELLDTIAESVSGSCTALNADENRLAYAVVDGEKAWVKVVDLSSGETSQAIELLPGYHPTAIALSPTDDRLLICTSRGTPFIAARKAEEVWQLTPIDRDDISAAVFSPQGERLIFGTSTGQVYIVKPQASETGLIARLLLTLPGHTDAVTVLRFANRDAKLSLLSGDAAGRVLLHPLQ